MVFHFYALIFFIKLVLWCWITVVLFNQVTWLWCFKICYQINYTLLYWGFLCPCSYVNFIYFSPVWCLIYFFCFCSVYCRKHFPFFNDLWLLSRFGHLDALIVDLKVGQGKKEKYLDSNFSGQWWLHLFSGSISYHTFLSLWFSDPIRELTIVPATAGWPLILGSSKTNFLSFCLFRHLLVPSLAFQEKKNNQ